MKIRDYWRAWRLRRLLGEVANENPRRRQAAAEKLGRCGGVQAISFLAKRLADEDEGVRRAASKALETMDPNWGACAEARQAIPVLILRQRGSSPEVRKAATEALSSIGDHGAVPALLEGLADPDSQVVDAALSGLTKLGGRRAILPLFKQCAAGYDDPLRAAAMRALRRIDPNWPASDEAREIVPHMISQLSHPKRGFRMGAIEFLKLVPDGRVLPGLIERLTDGDTGISTLR